MTEAPYDLIVVGGGTAGCVLAARASEDTRRRVLLVEAGPDPWPVPDVIADPARQPELIRETGYVRRYGVARPDGSRFEMLSGRVLGGGSAVNNLAAIRPMERDFRCWERFGGARWGYRTLLPLLRAIEDDVEYGEDAVHGRGGRLRITRPLDLAGPAAGPVAALLEAAQAVGLPLCPDMNAPEPYGVCSSPYNLLEGRRQTSADAYLRPALERPNLSLTTEATVARLLLEGRHVRGVELVHGGERRSVSAAEVVLCAGVFHSPQILQLSGIGPVRVLERAGVSVRHPLEGVGQGFQDHAVVYVAFAPGPDLTPAHAIPKLRLLLGSDPARDHPDLHVFFHPATTSDGRTVLPVSLRLLEHRSRGEVSIASPDPFALPHVDPALLRDPEDVRAVVHGLERVRELTAHPSLARFYGPLVSPGPDVSPEEHVLASYGTYHHGVGTCRLGQGDDPGAVVDPELRVVGIDGLRVADASVLPRVPHANTNLAAMLVGEVAAATLGAVARRA